MWVEVATKFQRIRSETLQLLCSKMKVRLFIHLNWRWLSCKISNRLFWRLLFWWLLLFVRSMLSAWHQCLVLMKTQVSTTVMVKSGKRTCVWIVVAQPLRLWLWALTFDHFFAANLLDLKLKFFVCRKLVTFGCLLISPKKSK